MLTRVLTLDGNSDYVEHARRKLFGFEKKSPDYDCYLYNHLPYTDQITENVIYLRTFF